MTRIHSKITGTNIERWGGLSEYGNCSLTRRSRRGGSSRLAVKVFKPSVARSQERTAKSIARSCAILLESSASGVDGMGAKGPEEKAICGGVLGSEWV